MYICGIILGRGWDKQNTGEKQCIKCYIFPVNTAEVQPLLLKSMMKCTAEDLSEVSKFPLLIFLRTKYYQYTRWDFIVDDNLNVYLMEVIYTLHSCLSKSVTFSFYLEIRGSKHVKNGPQKCDTEQFSVLQKTFKGSSESKNFFRGSRGRVLLRGQKVLFRTFVS